MNKQEQKAFEDLEQELRLAKALRFTEPVSKDVAPPPYRSADLLRKGFLFNAYSPRVEPACTSSGSHSFGRDDVTTTQQPVSLYSTRLRALRALRNAVEIECAKKLATIDKWIEDQNEKTT